MNKKLQEAIAKAKKVNESQTWLSQDAAKKLDDILTNQMLDDVIGYIAEYAQTSGETSDEVIKHLEAAHKAAMEQL